MPKKTQWVYGKKIGKSTYLIGKLSQKDPETDPVHSPYYKPKNPDRGVLLFTFLVIALYTILKLKNFID